MGKEAVPVLLSLFSRTCKLLETFCLQDISCCLCGQIGPDSALFLQYIKKITTLPWLQASQEAQGLRIRLPMQQMPVRSLGPEDPLEKERATHSSILAGKSHEQRCLEGYSPWGRKESDMTK